VSFREHTVVQINSKPYKRCNEWLLDIVIRDAEGNDTDCTVGDITQDEAENLCVGDKWYA